MGRSTAEQRAALTRLEGLLSEAFSMINARFWATRSQREAYETVLRHIRAWIAWEEPDDDE